MKKTSSKIYSTATILLAIVCSLPLAGQAQTIWLDDPGPTSQVGIELMIPSFDNFNTQGVAFASYLYAHLPVSDKIALQFDLPISHFSNGGGEANFAIGNPYIGFEYSDSPHLRWDLGVRAPVVNSFENALITGFEVENYKIGPFLPNAFTVESNIHYRSGHETGFGYRLGGGLEGLISTEGGGGNLYGKYYGQLLYGFDKFKLGAGLNGIVIASGGGGSLSDRIIHNLALSGSYDLGKVNIGAYIERSLDDRITDNLDVVLGLNLSIDF